VAGVRDNLTGQIWAAQAGTTGDAPSALELLTLADAGVEALRPFFGFAVGEQVLAAESVPDSQWVVDFGLQTAGRLSNEAVDPARPFVQLRLIKRADTFVGVDDNGNGTANQGRLMWSLCTEGTNYNIVTKRCDGTPLAMTLAQAKALAASSTRGNYTGWRLPTKQELQGLLRLGSGAATLLPDVMSAVDPVTGIQPLLYFTGSANTRAGLSDQPWAVDFSSGIDPGGVETISGDTTNPEYALVRLVRNW